MRLHQTDLKKRRGKLLLLLPIIAFPFLALLFWALGGGKVKQLSSSGTDIGMNTKLPDAHLPDDSAMNKMSFYDEEEKKSR